MVSVGSDLDFDQRLLPFLFHRPLMGARRLNSSERGRGYTAAEQRYKAPNSDIRLLHTNKQTGDLNDINGTSQYR